MTDVDKDFDNYLVEYSFGNSIYSIVIPARSWEEAQQRVKRIGAFGRVIGSGAFRAPASLGWFAKTLVWWRNLKRSDTP